MAKDASDQSGSNGQDTQPTSCGIVMPISTMGDCSEGHWSDVLSILTESVSTVGFKADLVSNADEVTIIQKTIVQNLYNLPIAICDVSEKNPNVMFELGLRLAFDKPTIIVKDDRTTFSFDTGIIEHLEYPRDLRFTKIIEFKRRLGDKVLATYEKSKDDPQFSTFLRHFGQFKVASLEEREVSGQEFIIEQLAGLQKRLDTVTAPPAHQRRPLNFPAGDEMDICCGPMNEAEIKTLAAAVSMESGVQSVRHVSVDDHTHLFARAAFNSVSERREMERRLQNLAKALRSKSRKHRMSAEKQDLIGSDTSN